MAKLLSENEVVTIVSVIVPYRKWREYARKEIGRFVEVYLRCPLEVRIKEINIKIFYKLPLSVKDWVKFH